MTPHPLIGELLSAGRSTSTGTRIIARLGGAQGTTTAAANGMTTRTIEERAAEIVAEFSGLDDRVARYRHLVSLGDAMPGADGAVRSEAHAIPGCEYDVWIRAEYDAEADVLRFEAEIGRAHV